MKAVYRSIKPYWLYCILIGKKTIEVGKTFPKADDWNKEVFLHCSKDMKSFKRIPEKDREWMRKYLGKCACRFVCNRIDRIGKRGINNNFDYCYLSLNVFGNDDIEIEITDIKKSCISKSELNAYGASSGCLYAWHISDLVIYDKPMEILEFIMPSKIGCCNEGKCRGCKYLDRGNGYNIEDDCNAKFSTDEFKPLRRPPQSWCYVEDTE